MRIPSSVTVRRLSLTAALPLALVASAAMLAGGPAAARQDPAARQEPAAPTAETAAGEAAARTAAPGAVGRGEYLVHQVAMCVQCHTPRDADGDLDGSRLLEGAPVPLASPYPNRPWAMAAPSLAGLAPWTEEQVVTLLTTGARPDGQVPRPPMPPFRMSRQDAEAVAAYLRSLR